MTNKPRKCDYCSRAAVMFMTARNFQAPLYAVCGGAVCVIDCMDHIGLGRDISDYIGFDLDFDNEEVKA